MSDITTSKEAFINWVNAFMQPSHIELGPLTERYNEDGTWSVITAEGRVVSIYGPVFREALRNYVNSTTIEEALRSATDPSSADKRLAVELLKDEVDAYFERRHMDRNRSFPNQ